MSQLSGQAFVRYEAVPSNPYREPQSSPMSSSASERPPRDKTSRPFATLDREKARRTDPSAVSEQPRTPEQGRAPEVGTSGQSRAPEGLTPEQLRKPYASLPPTAKRDDGVNLPESGQSAHGAPRTPVPNGRTTDATPRNRAHAAQVRPNAAQLRPNPTQCRKHQIQRNRAGVCLLCAKEEAAARGNKSRLLLWASVVVVLLAAALVIFLQKL